MNNNVIDYADTTENGATIFEISSPISDLSLFFGEKDALSSKQGKVSFCLVMQGLAIVEIDGNTWKLDRNVFFFLTPRHTLKLIFTSKDFSYRYITSEFDFIADFPLLIKPEVSKLAGNVPCIAIDNSLHRLFEQYYDLIYSRFYNNTGTVRAVITKGLFFSFVTEVKQLYSHPETKPYAPRQDKLVDRFFSLLHKYFKQERSAIFYADKLCVSDKHLMRTVKKQTGASVHFWIADFVIQEAKLKLNSSDKSVIEISDELGFPNSSSFARFFRNHVNLSPLEFKNRASKMN